MTDEPGRVDAETPDLAAEKLAQLQELFPGAFADGVLDAARIGELVGMPVAGLKEGRERYGLMWAGKQEAVASLLKPSRGTLVPDMERSIDFENARNVFIEGDNLEVLKILQKSYNDQVKLIYIDPPYNTGNDFVYNDDFSDGLRGYLEYTGQIDSEGKRTSATADTSGRKHSGWLSMMYPRLVLARNLLTQTGVMFISIDDNEVAQLRLVCDEVFGPENFIDNYIWQSNFRPDNSSAVERENSQHVLAYARNRQQIGRLVGTQKRTEGLPSLTKNSMQPTTLDILPEWLDISVPDGTYGPGDMGSGYVLEDEVTVADGVAQSVVRLTGRVIWSQEYLQSQADAGTRIVIKGTGFVPYSKKAETAPLPPTSLIARDEVGDVLAGNAELKALFGNVPFNHPKPTSLIRYLINAVTHDDKQSLVLDFFAGSGTTAHAVALLNSEDGGRRRCISVNLPEPTPEGSTARESGYLTVADVTYARIRKAMAALSELASMGLRVLRLGKSSFAEVESTGDLVTLLESSRRADATALDIAQEVFLREGVRLDRPWATSVLGGAERFASGGVTVVTDLELTQDAIEAAIESNPRVLVFLEDAFAGKDALKASAFYACKQAGVTMKTV